MFQRNKTPAVNPIQVLQVIDECNFRDEVFMSLLPRYGVAKGGGGKGGKKPASFPIEMPPMIKIITRKPYVFSVFFAFLPIQEYTSTTD